MGVKGRIHSIETFGTLDGPGIRYVLFLQGCALRCLYCHNPDTWAVCSNEGGTAAPEKTECAEEGRPVCGGGNICAGKESDSEDILKDILTYRNFIRSGGVTLSGGEPLLQPEFALDIISRCKANGLHTALDTAGSVPLCVSRPVLDAADLILLDIKALEDDMCVELTGRSNVNTLTTLNYCEKIKKPVWLRHVLVPGYTLDRRLLEDLAAYLSNFSCIQQVELLPFHKMGEYKWQELKLNYLLGGTPEPTVKELREAKKIFEDKGIPCLMKDI